jgi:hypothetical protein
MFWTQIIGRYLPNTYTPVKSLYYPSIGKVWIIEYRCRLYRNKNIKTLYYYLPIHY